ncbi:hypothetical protein L7F22_018856 [Adiantum nelumboides]|nr:hypothetical protein [Adiantum nelumboides]
MDFIFGLLKTSSGNEGIWTIVDRFSKQAHFIPVREQIIAEQMAKTFLGIVFKYHEMPRSIVSDRDPQMTGLFWRALWHNLHLTLRFSSPYHPQTCGQFEMVNSMVLDLLKCYVLDNPTQWEHCLPLVEFAYNNTNHSSTGKAPFEIVEGARKPPPLIKAMDDVFEADKFAEDWTWLIGKSNRPFRKLKTSRRKLQISIDVDCTFKKVIGSCFDLRRLSLRALWKIHDAFHVSLLRQFVGELRDQPEDYPQPEGDEVL